MGQAGHQRGSTLLHNSRWHNSVKCSEGRYTVDRSIYLYTILQLVHLSPSLPRWHSPQLSGSLQQEALPGCLPR